MKSNNSNSARTIILSRTNYGESDRIITIITEEGSKTVLMAKGVRKLKSKLAGGIELFCESELVYMGGRGKMGTLISCRVFRQYGNIVKDIDRTMFGYEILKLVNKLTEDEQLAEYYELLTVVFTSLDDLSNSLDIIKAWTYYRLLIYTGHQPNVYSDANGVKLQEKANYGFDISNMSLVESSSGQYTSRHIKLMRLIERSESPKKLSRVEGAEQASKDIVELLTKMIKFNL